jgi:eukaryotic-like serine/threonine-protein kinase
MPAEQYDLHAIFNAAIALDSSEEQASFLDEACGSDPALRQRIDALLRAHSEAGGFFGGKSPAPTATETRVTAETVGALIGPYKLLEQIGEGGFGTVYMAEQTYPVKRKVALKVIKPGMDTRQVIARFEAERQALALMDHPNIARVLDAGTTGEGARRQESGISGRESGPSLIPDSCLLTSDAGRPFFVMELVRGIPITDYCDQHQLTPHERLELFVTVCQAVQHAHQKGIIHRDIKPTNVLVTQHDEKAVAKVIDFGVAKAMSGQLTDKTLFTGFAQMIGTPLYMSPEQAEMSGLGVDTRTDIYGLGVLLYELLTGTTPFDRDSFQTAGYDEIRRIIREQEPAPPSARISTLGRDITVATDRRTDPQALRKQCRGELDWIVMKCLEKDRNRRYETANSLAADVLHYLANEPVQACPPSNWYRFRKLAMRHRGVLATAAIVTTCLFLLICGALVYATQQRDLAIGRTRLASDREGARQEAEAARVHAETALYRALLGRAAAVRTLRNLGYRREVWNYLHQAAALEVPDRDLTEIRNEVLACLGDPIGLDPIDFPAVERMPPTIMPAHFQAISDEARAGKTEKQTPITTAVSADGRWLAIRGGSRSEITLWDVNGQVVGKTSSPLGTFSSLAFSGDGKLLVAACEQGTVVMATPDLQLQTYFRGVSIYRRPVIDPWGHQFATFDHGQKIEIWSLRSNRLMATMMAPNGMETIEYSADGTMLLGIAGDGKTVIKGWPVSTTPEKQTLLGHEAAVLGLDFSPQGRLLASSSKDHSVRVWDADTGALLQHCAGHRGNVQAVKFSPDGRWLCSASWDGSAIVWDAKTGAQLAVIQVPTDLWDIDFDSTGRILAAVGSGRLECWEIKMTSSGLIWEHLRTVPLQHRGVDIAFRPGTSTVAILMQRPAALLLCDVKTSEPPQQLDARAFVGYYTLHFDRYGERLFFQSTGGPLGVWDVSQARAAYMRTQVPHFHHKFTPDSRWLAAPDQYPYDVRIFDVHADRQVFALPQGPQNKTESLAWSPDGVRLAVGGIDGDLAIWNLTEVEACLREFGIKPELADDETTMVTSILNESDAKAAAAEHTRRREWGAGNVREVATAKAARVSGGRLRQPPSLDADENGR